MHCDRLTVAAQGPAPGQGQMLAAATMEPARRESEHSSETLSHNQTFDRSSHILTSLIFELDLQSAGSNPFLTYTRLCVHCAIMIPYKVCSGRQFPVSESFFTLDF